ncbi:hypothetical protein [Mesorhizobium sp. IMUNJ 23232]|uniref:hypothetical protein n=1 Tax=Mesorhizobium sp. IMUNJ 23232 TaxID=3376064 RepID=UPI0037AA8EA8
MNRIELAITTHCVQHHTDSLGQNKLENCGDLAASARFRSKAAFLTTAGLCPFDARSSTASGLSKSRALACRPWCRHHFSKQLKELMKHTVVGILREDADTIERKLPKITRNLTCLARSLCRTASDT